MAKHKPYLLLLVILTILWSMTSTTRAWWWSNNDKAEIARLHGQLDQEKHTNGQQQIVIIILGIGCIATLVAGAALGSKARRAANEQRK